MSSTSKKQSSPRRNGTKPNREEKKHYTKKELARIEAGMKVLEVIRDIKKKDPDAFADL